MNKINQKDQIYKKIMEKIASDGWQMLDFESLSKEFDFDVLTKNGGVTNKMDLLVAFSEFVDASVKQLFDDDLKDGGGKTVKVESPSYTNVNACAPGNIDEFKDRDRCVFKGCLMKKNWYGNKQLRFFELYKNGELKYFTKEYDYKGSITLGP